MKEISIVLLCSSGVRTSELLCLKFSTPPLKGKEKEGRIILNSILKKYENGCTMKQQKRRY
jgi:hypothetical protein